MCVMPPVTPAPESPGYCHQLESAHLGAVMEGCDWSRARCLSYLCDQASPPIGQHSAIPLVRAPGHCTGRQLSRPISEKSHLVL